MVCLLVQVNIWMMLQVEEVEVEKCGLGPLLRQVLKARLESTWRVLEDLAHLHGGERVDPLHREVFELVLAVELSVEGLAAEPGDTVLI